MATRRTINKLALIVLQVLWIYTPAYSGGLQVIESTVQISGSSDRRFQPNASISVSFKATDYSYASPEFKYVFFAIVPRDEVLERVTSQQVTKWQLFHILMRSPHKAANQLAYKLRFSAPSDFGQFKLVYHQVPWFGMRRLENSDKLGQLARNSEDAYKFIREHLERFYWGWSEIVNFEVSSEGQGTDPFTIYLKANGKNPAFADVKGGLRQSPLKISWSVGSESKLRPDKVLYRYKLWPEENDWSAWTSDRSIRYHFLQKGFHNFSVMGMYKRGDHTIESQPATFDFALDDHMVVKPSSEVIFKGPQTKQFTVDGEDVPPSIAFDTVYAHSKALIVGVWQFSDNRFARFPKEKIEKDIETVGNALKLNNFEVTTLFRDRLSRDEIATALEMLVNAASKDDRLFIYFSSHGFRDKTMPSEAYIATSDCEMDHPSVKCLRLTDIEHQARRALEKQSRQVLIAADSCFSGLGIITKSSGPVNLARLASAQGLFMMTAGMADQLAEIDPTLNMSTFTHYLAKGLRGEASVYDKSGVITLSELLLYVQYNVARTTNSRQIPMLGRVKGDGEMLFRPMH
ncbi:conserved protein of unknown function [Nitrospira japonica]|uniref:Peptidase C14 caspase domain-containing protein n=1 Tax=Nitrospira japonica TaxID=1325564 RepID=A0A1W1I368_9BACT|nr:caspase family protein [Nitrospira japonica]SLM47434.1 conserved protein of unknown function [Nitrospira japonica]